MGEEKDMVLVCRAILSELLSKILDEDDIKEVASTVSVTLDNQHGESAVRDEMIEEITGYLL